MSYRLAKQKDNRYVLIDPSGSGIIIDITDAIEDESNVEKNDAQNTEARQEYVTKEELEHVIDYLKNVEKARENFIRDLIDVLTSYL